MRMTTSDMKQSSISLSLKKEPLEMMETIEPHIATDVALVSDELLQQLDSRPNVHEINEESNFPPDKRVPDDSTKLNLRKKRGRKRKLQDRLSDYIPQRSFSIKWLTKPELRDWLTPVPSKPTYVSCKWCKALLRAHLHDLKKHAASKKHRKHSLVHSNVSSSVKEESNRLNLDDYFTYFHSIRSNSNPELKVSTRRNVQEAVSAETNQPECLNPARIGFIGSGNMAQALISGFISNGLIEPSNVIVSAPSNRNLLKLKPLGIRTTHDNKTVIEESDMVYLAVKPHIIPEVLGQLEPIEGSHNPLFVSIATGLSITRLEAMLSHVVSTPRVIRIMPNTPCMVLQGCCVYSLGTNVQPAEGKVIKCLLGSVGLCEEVSEYQIDGVCGLAGSGPAYIYAAIEAMADGGVKMGLPRNLAMALAAQTVKGAASMVLETGKHPGQLKDEVCSPGGTTIAAMHVLEKNGVRNAFISAVEASAKRSKELG